MCYIRKRNVAVKWMECDNLKLNALCKLGPCISAARQMRYTQVNCGEFAIGLEDL